MPRKARRQDALPVPSDGGYGRKALPGYVLTAVVAAALGAGATYLSLRPAHQPPPPPSLLGTGGASSALALANRAFDQRDWPQAVVDYGLAVAGGADNPDVRTDFGTALRNAGQPQKALEQYQIAQREDPRHENSLFNQGVVYAADLNQPVKALAVWQQYLQRFPGGQHSAEARHLVAELQAHLAPAGAGPTRP